MNKKYLRIELKQHKFKVWGLNYKFEGEFGKKKSKKIGSLGT
jgi:hypothetical protein